MGYESSEEKGFKCTKPTGVHPPHGVADPGSHSYSGATCAAAGSVQTILIPVIIRRPPHLQQTHYLSWWGQIPILHPLHILGEKNMINLVDLILSSDIPANREHSHNLH